jgi:hypothetical protein
MRRWLRFAVPALILTAALVGLWWPWVDGEGRRGLLVAAGAALPLHLVAFGILLREEPGTPRFLAVWAGGTLLRMLAVGVVAGVVWFREDVDPLTALLALAGLLVSLLFLELWAMQTDEDGPMNGSDQR